VVNGPPAAWWIVSLSRHRAGRWLSSPFQTFPGCGRSRGPVPGGSYASDSPRCRPPAAPGRGRRCPTTGQPGDCPNKPAPRRPLAAQPTQALRRGERAWLPRFRRAPRVARCGDACRTRPSPFRTCGLERATLASCGKCPHYHPADRASSAATAKPPISRAIIQGGKRRRIPTAKSPAIGENLADESWPKIRFATGRWPPGLERLTTPIDSHRMDGYDARP